MTKAQSAEIKAIIGKGYKTYYSSQKEQLSVRVYSYINNNLNAEAMERSIKNLLNKVEGMHLQYEIIQRTYQGFIHDTCVIFK